MGLRIARSYGQRILGLNILPVPSQRIMVNFSQPIMKPYRAVATGYQGDSSKNFRTSVLH